MQHYSTTDQRIHTLITWARSSSSGARRLELLTIIVELAPEMTDTDGERARLLCRVAHMLHELRGVDVPQNLIVRALQAARSSTHAEPRAEAIARLARMIRDRDACNAAQTALLAEIRALPDPHTRALALLAALRFYPPFQRIALFDEAIAAMTPDQQRAWATRHPGADTVIHTVVQSAQPEEQPTVRARIHALRQPDVAAHARNLTKVS